MACPSAIAYGLSLLYACYLSYRQLGRLSRMLVRLQLASLLSTPSPLPVCLVLGALAGLPSHTGLMLIVS